MRVLIVLSLVAVLSSGCAQLKEALATSGIQPEQPRNYVNNPVTLGTPVPVAQPTFGTTPGEQYQTILVNTPTGMVYKRCRVLNGKAVACF